MEIQTRRIATLILALLLASGSAMAEPAATVRYLLGSAEAVAADGARRALAKGDAVLDAERVVTGASSFIDLDFADGGRVLLHPRSELLIEEFRMPAPAPAASAPSAAAAPESAFLRLVKGGLRAVTGAIGKKDRQRYGVRTPMVTIGVRGTEFELRLCQGDCVADPPADGAAAAVAEPPLADGLYAGVAQGEIVLANEAGEQVLERGEYAWVRDVRTLGERIRERPRALDRDQVDAETARTLKRALRARYEVKQRFDRVQRTLKTKPKAVSSITR
jgi:hypothetical protein